MSITEENNMEGRKIVVAVDESEESMYALSWCLGNLLSQNHKPTSTLILLYIRPPLDVNGYLFANDVIATMEKHNSDLTNSVMRRAEAVYKNFNTTVAVEKKVGSGDAKYAICTAVEKLGADILVMGSHDYGFFKRALLGSVSDYCAKHVKCPLVVVKHPKAAKTRDDNLMHL
ncbi:universal stress protein PHOS32-like [Olea europaea var. sylvestris]|uniref:Universal stress A n=1 Tax=Olea europaea subsp. europaea TaxID=158383 RepID=A0A8S0SAH3_OLEEU|nr:universal stress protein PHOS32-like [Olea europaea var. sylvestris]CAA2989407.1 universal stress A [Olea europaea subsp. europaea]